MARARTQLKHVEPSSIDSALVHLVHAAVLRGGQRVGAAAQFHLAGGSRQVSAEQPYFAGGANRNRRIPRTGDHGVFTAESGPDRRVRSDELVFDAASAEWRPV